MRLTDAQRKTIATLNSMANEAADQWVGEPEAFGLPSPKVSSDGTSLEAVQSVRIEFCTGWVTQEVVIHLDGSLETLDERLA
tara:strand:- start:247 stop:492 length:246 start_codon:yes stop_codon:yes gene_type:complete